MSNITYTSLTFDETTGKIVFIGTSDCDSIKASIISPCRTIEKLANVDQSGNWQIEYSGNEIRTSINQISKLCGAKIKINSFCTNKPEINGPNDFFLTCKEDKKCPELRLTLLGLSDNCQNGQKTANFEITFVNASLDSVYEINFGNGNDEIIYFDSNENPLSISNSYSGGNYTVVVNSIMPRNCPSSNEIELEVSICDETCPNVALELVSVSECNTDGTRTATFRINVSNVLTETFVYEIDFGDGMDQNIRFDNTTNNPIVITHNYVSGNYSSIVNSFIPDGCPSSNTVLVSVSECIKNCPNDIDLEIIDSKGNRFLVVDNNGIFEPLSNNTSNQRISCLSSGRYILRVINPRTQGLTFIWREDQNPPIQSESRDFNFSLTRNEEKIIMVVVKKDECLDLPESIRILECSSSDNDNNDNDNNENEETNICDLCCWWFSINIILLFATLIAFAVAGCLFQWIEPISLGTAIGLLLATTASIIAWGIVCRGLSGRSCRSLLRLMDLLDILTILAGFLVFLFGIVSPCAIAFWINVGLLQWFRRILQTIGVLSGCLPNPWFGSYRR